MMPQTRQTTTWVLVEAGVFIAAVALLTTRGPARSKTGVEPPGQRNVPTVTAISPQVLTDEDVSPPAEPPTPFEPALAPPGLMASQAMPAGASTDLAGLAGEGRVATTKLRARAHIARGGTGLGAAEHAVPVVEPSVAELDGGEMAAQRLGRELQSRRPQVEACIVLEERHHQRAANAKVTVSWLVQTDGTTSHIAVDEDANVTPATAACIKHAVAGWTFTPPQGGSAPVSLSVVVS